MSKRFFFILILSVLLPGCAEFYGKQPPAPVYGGGSRPIGKTQQSPYPEHEEKPQLSKREPTDTVMTEPLKESTSAPESIEFKPEPPPSETETVEPDEQVGEQPPVTQSLEPTQKSQ